jgi:hypothetical protein
MWSEDLGLEDEIMIQLGLGCQIAMSNINLSRDSDTPQKILPVWKLCSEDQQSFHESLESESLDAPST